MSQAGEEIVVPTVGRIIQEKAQERGLSFHELASKLNTHYTYVLKLISGQREIGHVMAYRLAQALGGSMEDWLIVKIRRQCAEYRQWLTTREGQASDSTNGK